MHSWRSTAAAAAAVGLLSLLAGCGGGDSEADPIPEATSSSPSEPTSSPSATETGGPPAGWEDKFTPEQLDAYNSALTRWQRYNEVSNELARVGKYTEEAEKFYREYSIRWQGDVAILRYAEENKIKVEQAAEPLWTYSKSIKLNNDGKTGNLVILQCTDYSKIQYLKDGQEVDNKPKNLVTVLTIQMTKPEGFDWMIAGTELKDKTSCEA